MLELRKSFLIMEKQENITEVLSFYLESKFNFEPVKCIDSTAAIRVLNDQSIVLVLCGNGIYEDDRERLMEAYDAITRSGKRVIFQDINIFKKKVKRGTSADELSRSREESVRELLSTIETSFEVDPAIEHSEYAPISPTALPYFEGIDTDLYIKLITGRFLKLFREGDKVEHSDILKYKDKGVRYLYINKICYSWMVKNIEMHLGELFSDPNYTVKPDLNTLMEIMNVEREMYEEMLERVKDVKLSLMKINNLKNYLLAPIDRNVENFINNRTRLTSIISCGIAKELSWGGSDKSLEKLLIAAHLHDIVLMKNPKLAMIKDESHFTRCKDMFTTEDYDLFKSHPEMTVRLLEADPNIPSETIIIISQHHEIPNATGFPNKLDHRKMKPYSCLFIVSLDLATYIISNSDWQMDKFIELSKKNYSGPVFAKIIRVLSDMRSLKGKRLSVA